MRSVARLSLMSTSCGVISVKCLLIVSFSSSLNSNVFGSRKFITVLFLLCCQRFIFYLRSHLGNDIQSGSTINTQTSPQSVLSGSSTVLINDIVGFIISCFAAYLAWSCNPTMTFMRRFSHAVLAFLFGMFYLVYSISFITTMCTNSSAVSITAVSAFGNGYY